MQHHSDTFSIVSVPLGVCIFFGFLRKKPDFLGAGVRHPHHNKVLAKGGK